MATPAARMEVSAVESGSAVIAIIGEVTSACEEHLMRAHESATDAGATRVVLDFSRMQYMNSGGIGMLVTLLVRAQRRQQGVAAIGLTEHYRQIFHLTRLDEAISLHDDLTSALNALRP